MSEISTTGKLRVLIVEDHVALAENLFEFLGEERYVLDFAADGLTGMHLAASNVYDVIILDVMLPGINGFDLCQRLRTDLRCTTPIIMLTAKGNVDDKETGFSQGADDYLVKPFDMRELELRIRALNHRSSQASSCLTAADIRYWPGKLEVRPLDSEASVTLSGIAATLFEMLIRAYPNYVSHQALNEQLWGEQPADAHTLRTHVYALRKSLKSALGRSLVRSVHGRGYRLDPDSEE